MHFIVFMNWSTTKKGKTWLSPLWLSADISTTGPIIKILKRVKYGTTCFGNRTHHYYSEWMVIWIQSCRNSLQIWKLPIFFFLSSDPKIHLKECGLEMWQDNMRFSDVVLFMKTIDGSKQCLSNSNTSFDFIT